MRDLDRVGHSFNHVGRNTHASEKLYVSVCLASLNSSPFPFWAFVIKEISVTRLTVEFMKGECVVCFAMFQRDFKEICSHNHHKQQNRASDNLAWTTSMPAFASSPHLFQ